jgi:hypothetical protein
MATYFSAARSVRCAHVIIQESCAQRTLHWLKTSLPFVVNLSNHEQKAMCNQQIAKLTLRQADETTSHSTRLPKDDSQVAGYQGERTYSVFLYMKLPCGFAFQSRA